MGERYRERGETLFVKKRRRKKGQSQKKKG